MKGVERWQKRFFTLEESSIKYWQEAAEASKDGATPKGILTFEFITDVTISNQKGSPYFSLKTKDRVYKLRAEAGRLTNCHEECE